VLYVQDGQNVFDAATAYGGVEWGLDETLERLIAAGLMEPVIVVAVYNTERRAEHYTPASDPRHGGGRADDYGRFLVEELKPFLDARLRTRPDARDTAIMGSSLGGLLSLHLAMSRPDAFGRAAALSPSLWWAGDEMLSRLEDGAHPDARPRLWVDMGGREGGDEANRAANTGRLRRLAAALRSRGMAEGSELASREFPEAGHHEAAWAARVGEVLRFLFPP
jgi:predicted alpha/beta superfamily hydrolase